AGSRRRKRTDPVVARRGRPQAPAPCERTLSRGRGRASAAWRQGPPTGARSRRTSTDRQRNGPLRVMLKPRALHHGDRLAIVAPASSFNRTDFDQGIAEIESLGFVPVYDHSVFARHEYVAGAGELRGGPLRSA